MLTVSSSKASLTIFPERRFDALNYRAYLRQVSQAIEAGVGEIVFDFRNVEFMDTYGLSVLIKGSKLAQASGAELRVCNVCHEAIVMIFRVTNISRFVKVELPTV